MNLLDVGTLRTLTETPGGPGDEGAIRNVIARKLQPHVDTMRVDSMGNLITLKRGTGASELKVVLAAHMDEVVFMVQDIRDDGLLQVRRSGGVNLRTVVGKVVQVGPDRLPGVIGWPPVHMTDLDNYRQTPDQKELVVDIGAQDDKTARARVKRGQRVCFRTAWELMGVDAQPLDGEALPTRGRMSGKAFDDRLGCAVVMEVLAGDRMPFDLYGVFTVQEEIGTRGARIITPSLKPDVILALEGTVCDDVPGDPENPVTPTTRLGSGPALTQRDRSYIVHPAMLQYLRRTAEQAGISYQFKQPNVGGTDASAFAYEAGMPVGLISVPCRYIHSPVAVADLHDFQATIDLVKVALLGIVELDEVEA